MSLPSGFNIKEFIGVKIESMAMSSNCTVDLKNGSGASIISSNLGQGFLADDVLGYFYISSSDTNTISVNYSLCVMPATLNITNTTMMNHNLILGCSNLQIVITDTMVATDQLYLLRILFARSVSNNSVAIKNFSGSVNVTSFDESTIQLDNMCADVEDPALCFNEKGDGNTVLIENSAFVDQTLFVENPNTKCNSGVKSILMTLRNVTVTNTSTPVYLQGVTAKFVDCTFESNSLTAIYGDKSNLIFKGSNTFENNLGLFGAGMILVESCMYLMPYTHILFHNNHVYDTGAAIYSRNYHGCFFYVVSHKQRDTISIDFTNNTAGAAGTSLYGGIDNCDEASQHDFYNIFHINNTESDPSAIASGPSGVCICKGGSKLPSCDSSDNVLNIHSYPGQEFSVRLAVVSIPFFGAVPGVISACTTHPNATLEPSQKTQGSSTPSCKVFNYSVSSIMSNVELELKSNYGCNEQVAESIYGGSDCIVSVDVHLMECPLGFPLSPTQGKCQCDSAADQYDVECNINSHSFFRSANSRTWIGFIDESSDASSKPGMLYHLNCPIGYCSRCDVNITSNTSDDQCEPHRTGLLCGECEEGYSLTLGDGKCAQCSNTHLLLILPLALSGLFLVAILFALNLTVTEGSINGFIFYANVIGMNRAVLLSGETGYLYIFLAWINLDIGISTCLFNGMDAYSEIWLQFVFPVYLWMIILVITQLYRKFPASYSLAAILHQTTENCCHYLFLYHLRVS